jgi:membrane associated rhomboid family serine protease
MHHDEALPWHETTEHARQRGRTLARRVFLWSWVLIGIAAVVVVVALHVVPSAGAAGGCGGG